MSFALALMLVADFGLDPAWKPVADPLAPARAGKIQCHDADPAARTCRVMSWFDQRPDGSVMVRQLTALPNAPTLAAEGRFRLTPEGAALCAVVDENYMAGFRIVSSRAPFAPLKDDRVMLLFREALVGALWKRKTCAHGFARADDPMLQEVGTIDGQFAGELMSQYFWVESGAGWRLKAPG